MDFYYSIVKPQGEVVELPSYVPLPLSTLVAQFPGASIAVIPKSDKKKGSVWLQDFVKFFNELRRNDSEICGQHDEKILETANSLKTLKDSFWFGQQYFGTELFVRQCYIDLAKMILSIFDENVYFNGVALVGTPGIGKSQFLSYLFWFILVIRKDIENIVVTSVDDDEMLIVKRTGEVKGVGINDRDSLGNLAVKKTICLYDPANLNKRVQSRVPAKFPLFLVAACSSSTNKEAFIDQGSGLTVNELFMPLWSEKELREAGERSQYYWRPDLFDNLFACIGGTVRYTLKIAQHTGTLKTDVTEENKTKSTKEEVKGKMESADEMIRKNYARILKMVNMAIEQHKITADGSIVFAKDIIRPTTRTGDAERHMFKYFAVNITDKDWKCILYKCVIATKYVAIELFKRVDEEEFKRCLQLMKSSHNSIHRRYMFETYVHLMFKSKITLPIYKYTKNKLGNKSDKNTFKCSSVVEFFGSSLLGRDGQLKPELVSAPVGAYCMPRYKNFKSIDSMIWPDKMLQITLSDSHDMDTDFLVKQKNILKTHKNVSKLILYFVTPLDVYQKFNVQDELFEIFAEIYTVGIDLNNANVKRAMRQGRPRKNCEVVCEDDVIQLDDPEAATSATISVNQAAPTSAAVNQNAPTSAMVNEDASTSASVNQNASTKAFVSQDETLSVSANQQVLSSPGRDVDYSEHKGRAKSAKVMRSMMLTKHSAKKSKNDANYDKAEEMDTEEGVDSAKPAAAAAARDARNNVYLKGSKKLVTPKEFSAKTDTGRGRKNKGDGEDEEEKIETEREQVKDKAARVLRMMRRK